MKIVQTPRLITILDEELAFRQIFLDGRSLPTDPNPSFMGYSVGRWEGETLVVDSTGFNDRTWLDFGGHPHTEGLRITERFRRTSTGHIDLQVTLSDPAAYSRPWTVPVSVTLAADTDLLEYVCTENQNPRMTLGRTEAEKAVRVSPDVLSRYVGHETGSWPSKAIVRSCRFPRPSSRLPEVRAWRSSSSPTPTGRPVLRLQGGAAVCRAGRGELRGIAA